MIAVQADGRLTPPIKDWYSTSRHVCSLNVSIESNEEIVGPFEGLCCDALEEMALSFMTEVETGEADCRESTSNPVLFSPLDSWGLKLVEEASKVEDKASLIQEFYLCKVVAKSLAG